MTFDDKQVICLHLPSNMGINLTAEIMKTRRHKSAKELLASTSKPSSYIGHLMCPSEDNDFTHMCRGICTSLCEA